MRVLVTGADGFIGRALVAELLHASDVAGKKITRLLLVDRQFEKQYSDSRVRIHCGDIGDPRLLRRVLADGVSIVFHLASVPGAAAEKDYSLGYQVNLLGSQEIIEQIRCMEPAVRLVFASSVAVYGDELAGQLHERSFVRPRLSYGCHKHMIELLVDDLGRRGEIDGCAVRLPGVVARPQSRGMGSAFMSDLLVHIAEDRHYICPVSETATAWWLSLKCCVENLVRLAEVDAASLDKHRIIQLPVLHLSIAQVVDALAKRFGEERRSLVTFEPDAHIEKLFGQYPKIRTPWARQLGLAHDGNVHRLVRNALAEHAGELGKPASGATHKHLVKESV
ncbi:NAD-dependent epimerase/dehydratase family protein [Marinobacter sp. DUT-3]|uniref:NAD-dependent epimerase/dehydratase family protein n=1 Tax=Marinobacter sp. DUT-3 TaxID=3412036 RepID=UPI003D179A30